jgi:subtilisin family serine protease
MFRSALAVAAVTALVAPAAARADIIVQRAPGASAAEVRDNADVDLVDSLPIARTQVVKPDPGQSQADALAALNADPDVVYAEPDQAMHALTTDYYWASEWDLPMISAPQAWSLSTGAGVTVGVVDTGVNLAHTDLAGQIAPGGYDFVDGDSDPTDQNGHGTHVSGTIAAAADNGLGVAGVAPGAKVLPLRALNANGSGSMANVAAAFAYAGQRGVPVVNASLGGGYSQTVANAIAAYPHTLYVVAAGNDGADDDNASTAEFPCALPLANVLCVGATDSHDQPASFSNYGARSVDLYAPGVNILSTYYSSSTSYAYMSGTSMATPHVAGAAALVFAADPGVSAAQVKAALLSTADPVPALSSRSVSGGRLDAGAAVASILGVTPEAAAPPTPSTPPAPVSTPAPPVSAPAPVSTPAPAPVAPSPAPVRPSVPAPVLRHLHVGGSLRTRHGELRVTFSLNRAATVRFTVVRKGSTAGTWSVRARAGANAFTLARRLPTHRTLARGAYTLRVGLAGTASTARFSVR